ncbi:MAG: pyridoxal-phosphate dependent enzyme [Microbacteriaceae bacterium]|nr:pyridoxal-phosphate dependent enzyme [Microbacteriaceae bacterium]
MPRDWFREQVARGAAGAQAVAFPEAAREESFDEGGTPLRSAPYAAGAVGANAVWVKDETRNPTGSFKDRLNAVATAAIAGLGGERLVTSSTGNQAVAAVWYARRRGLVARAFLPEEVPGTAPRVIEVYGGEAVIVPWGDRSGLVRELVDLGWDYVGRNAPRPLANPYGMEGYKSIAVEIVAELGRVPDVVVMPACGGDGIAGVVKGFRSLAEADLAERVPAVVAVQPETCDSLVVALADDAESVRPTALGESIAHSLRDERAGDHALHELRSIGGAAVTVSDDELRRAMGEMGALGVFVEPAGAAALAGLRAALARVEHRIPARPEVVVIATGAGDRWPASLEFEPSSRGGRS